MALNYVTFTKKYFVPLWYWYAAGLIFLTATNYVTVKTPNLAGQFTNAVNKVNPSELETLALQIIGLGVAQLICRTLSRVLIFWPGRDIEARSKVDIFASATRLPQVYLDKFGVGDLISRLSNDLGQLRVFYAFGILMLLNLTLLFTFTISQMWRTNPTLTTLCLAPLCLMLLLTRFIMPRLQKFNRQNAEDQSDLTNQVTEAFVNIHLVKANGAEEAFSRRIDEKITKVYESSINLIGTRTVLFPLVTCLAGVAQLAVLFWGGREVIEGRLMVGDILAFNVYLAVLAFPLTSLGIIIAVYQRGKTSLSRLDEIASAERQKTQPAQDLKPTSAVIEIRNLQFAYPAAEVTLQRENALRGLSLTLKKNEKVGLCGPVGSGKSTLFSVMTRLYDASDGEILLEGRNILTIEPELVRKKINYALQVPHFFSDTIENNLRFGLHEVTQEQLEEACRKACIYDDIANFPDHWQTQVGEKGVRLSGGQKHRLALARLFLRDAPVWLLDDVLSAVDAPTEEAMLKAIFAEDRTLLVASHRPRPLELCDRVLLIRDGAIHDEGKFRELLARHPELQAENCIHE